MNAASLSDIPKNSVSNWTLQPWCMLEVLYRCIPRQLVNQPPKLHKTRKPVPLGLSGLQNHRQTVEPFQTNVNQRLQAVLRFIARLVRRKGDALEISRFSFCQFSTRWGRRSSPYVKPLVLLASLDRSIGPWQMTWIKWDIGRFSHLSCGVFRGR